MSTNPLKKAGTVSNFTSAFRACEWAWMARDKGNKCAAEAWERAARDGWDDLHFSEIAREELRKQAAG